MTNPIPGADSERPLPPLPEPRIKEGDAVDCRAQGDYFNESQMEAYVEADRAAAKVGANVAADKMLFGALNHARETLRYYAEQEHFVRHQPDEWDTVSGEPESLYEDSHNTATVEDGTLAKNTLSDIAGVEAYASAAAGAPAETPKPVGYVHPDAVDRLREDAARKDWSNIGLFSMPREDRGVTVPVYLAAQPIPAPIAGDVEKDARLADIMNSFHHAWTESDRLLCESRLRQCIADICAAMLANSSSGEAG